MEECDDTTYKHEEANYITCHGNHYSKTVKLLVKRCFYVISYLSSRKNLSVLCHIAYGKDTAYTMAFHNLCSTHHMIGREGRICIELGLIHGLMAYRFACKR